VHTVAGSTRARSPRLPRLARALLLRVLRFQIQLLPVTATIRHADRARQPRTRPHEATHILGISAFYHGSAAA
jgi:hypothetical protein